MNSRMNGRNMKESDERKTEIKIEKEWKRRNKGKK